MPSDAKFIFHGKTYEYDSNGNPVKLVSSATASAGAGATAAVSVSTNDNGVINFDFTLPIGPT